MSAVPSQWQLHNAARLIKKGGVIAYPTEAVYGLGCDPTNRSAVERLLSLKNRQAHKGLILIAASRKQLGKWLKELPAGWERQLENSWPGPVTWLVPAANDCPKWLTGKHVTLAVRVTAHPVARQLCQLLGSAIVSTSANKAGKNPAKSRLQVRLQFGKQVDYVLPGELGGLHGPTEIRDLASGQVIRRQSG